MSSVGTALEPFDFDGNPVRCVMIEGEPWFVAADVCAVLGIARAADAVQRLDEGEYQQVAATTVSSAVRPGVGAQSLTVVSEPGLYSLVLGSRKPDARRFKRWVTSEVLPRIRRTGVYAVSADPFDVMQGMLDTMRAQRDRLDTHDRAIRELRTSAGAQQLRIDQLEENHERVTAVGYANTHGIRSDVVYLARLGRIASVVAKAWGIPLSRVHSTVWGEVNAWPVEVWDEALTRVGG